MNLIEDTQLMKQSKADLVAALNDVGVTQATADTPLSEVTELMKWAGGLRDVTLACVSKSDGKQAFFTRKRIIRSIRRWKNSTTKTWYLSFPKTFRRTKRYP